MRKKKVDVITLGCSKNLVDSERLIKQFEAGGFEVEHDSSHPTGEIAVINTCGFIGDAKEESIEMILNFAAARKRGDLEKLFVMGCLSERYFEQLGTEIPEVDKFYGKFNWNNLISDLGMTYRADLRNERTLTTPNHYAYLKISEGCDRTCSYCAIPLITGKHQSRTIESLVEEVQLLAAKGVKEIQLIAQELTYYGLDIYKKRKLTTLIQEISKVEGIEWIRLHYAYPSGFPLDLLDEMAINPKVCKYLDIALQHISDPMLKSMRRNVTTAQTMELIAQMRERVPGIHLRTTLITGHPNETQADFEQLKAFVIAQRFDRLGVFPYSHEEDTFAHKNYTDNIPEDEKQERANIIMELQSEISLQLNQKKIGTHQKVIIDRLEEEFYVGRTQFDSPEVDPEVLISTTKPMIIGEFYTVTITDAQEYDLLAHWA